MLATVPSTMATSTLGEHALSISCEQHSCIQALQVFDVFRLYITSKQLSERLIGTLTADGFLGWRQLLRSAVREASATGPHAGRHHLGVEAVQWLLSTASIPQHLIAQDTPILLSSAIVPLAMAERLVSAGARVTYQQLVSAARSQVYGVHVWVVAQQLLRMPTDMPRIVETICRSDASCIGITLAQQIQETLMSLDEVVETMYITLNVLPDSKYIGEIMRHLVAAPASGHIDSDTAIQLCRAAMQICRTRAVRSDLADECFSNILKLQAFSDLPAPDALALMLVALQLGVPATSWYTMLTMLKVERLDKVQRQAVFAAAVQAAVQHWYRQTELCSYIQVCTDARYADILPRRLAFEWLTCQLLCDMLHSAIQALASDTKGTPAFDHLIELEAYLAKSERVPVSAVTQLLSAAVTVCGRRRVSAAAMRSCLGAILKLSAAAEVTAAELESLLHQAVTNRAEGCISWLLQTPRATEVSSSLKGEAVAALLQLMVQKRDLVAVSDLCNNAVLQQYLSLQPADAIAALIESLLECRNNALQQKQQQIRHHQPATSPAITAIELASSLTGLHSKCVQSDLAGNVLHAAVLATSSCGQGDLQLSRLLAALPAAVVSKISVEAFTNAALLVLHDSEKLRVICQLPTVGELHPAALSRVIETAVVTGNVDSVCGLLELPAAAEITAAEVSELILTAISPPERAVRLQPPLHIPAGGSQSSQTKSLGQSASTDFRMVYFLCQLDGAQSIPADGIAALLQIAVKHGDPLDVEALALMPGALQMDHGNVQTLMEAALLSGSMQKQRVVSRLQSRIMSRV